MSNVSILPPEMKGVMFISGYRGKGKTFLAAQADLPANIAFFDFEDKGGVVDSQLHFGYYKAISMSENNNLARSILLLDEIEKLPPDKFTVAILDNIRPLEDALMALVMDKATYYAKLYGRPEGGVIKNVSGAAQG